MKQLTALVCVFILLLLYIPSKGGDLTRSDDSATVVLKNLGASVNSRWADFAPVINADGSELIFTSRRPVSASEIKTDSNSFERIYFAKYIAEADSFSNAVLLGTEVNEPNRNNSAIALSNDGQTMLIYRDDDTGNGDIYVSSLIGSKWSKAERLPAPINSKSHESSACFSPDGNTIYFVSQRKGGIGGRDIWWCKKDSKGKWGEALNLGPPVNTFSDE
jgi:Tol biopolymer transport system component